VSGRIPAHLGPAREFKARKRRELARLERAVYAVLNGAAYTPIVTALPMLAEVKRWREVCSAKAWGR
jgi:hypothetical protein